MNYDEALEFFALYGNVSTNIERLRQEKPSRSQLSKAVEYAVVINKQPREIAIKARETILNDTGNNISD